MKNKLLIGIAIILLSFVLFTRMQFKKRLNIFNNEIEKFEQTNYEIFQSKKDHYLDSLNNNNDPYYTCFKSFFSDSSARKSVDTTFNYLYLKKRLQFESYDIAYLNCLLSSCQIINVNNEVDEKIEAKKLKLENEYPLAYSELYPKLNDKLNSKGTNYTKCSDIDEPLFELSFDLELWSEFEKILSTYEKEAHVAKVESNKEISKFKNLKNKTLSKLKSSSRNEFKQKLESKEQLLLNTETITKTYTSDIFGFVNYTFEKEVFNSAEYLEMEEVAFKEQWKTNSLSTGAKPYAYCYGSSNYCNGYGCSQIKVRTPSNSDVLVSIKKDGKVYRHAYIRASSSYTFEVSSGSYQTFFYYGNGWDPNKFMKKSTCGTLKGGFVSNEDVSKSEYEYLSNNILEYELIQQISGNFSPRSSSVNEAL